uniref:Uncharacterized protein n=1 Tax=Anguilla anguilla TaxID=7936 RepID=A0A0E9VJD4_ANGAN
MATDCDYLVCLGVGKQTIKEHTC